MNWKDILEQVLTQFGALIVFFAFPAIQYTILKHFALHAGHTELWYLPDYGFRLVIRNIPHKRTFSDIRYRAFVRTVVPRSAGSSVSTSYDEILIEKEDFFLFPKKDQILVAFKLDTNRDGELELINNDRLGREIGRVTMSNKSRIIVDYTANLENLFNFDIRLARRIEITSARLKEILCEVRIDSTERSFAGVQVHEVG